MWLKDRKEVYIPKPEKTSDRVGILRQLSLLESLYKIQTRVLLDRLSGVMDEISYPDQHGFRRGLEMLYCLCWRRSKMLNCIVHPYISYQWI